MSRVTNPADDRRRAPAPEVAPLDVDGVRAVVVGTVAWVVALVALLPFQDDLREDGRLWWLATCAVGALLGLAGLVYVRRRRAAINRRR